MEKRYFYTLDLIRFIAATMVAFFHLTWLNNTTEAFAHWGWIGVQIFFVLSGFVILESARHGNAANFVHSRILRLYPVAIICSIISFVILIQNHGFELGLLKKLLKSITLFIEGPYLATAYWTLPIEMAFYFLIFLIIKFWSIRKINKVITWITVISSTYVILYSLKSFRIIYAPYLEFGYGPGNMLLLRHGIYFSMGMILYLQFHNEINAKLKGLFLIAFSASLLEILSRALEINKKIQSISLIESILAPVIVLSIFIVLMYLIVTRQELIPNKYQNLIRTLGLSSYPIYLIHEVLGNRLKDIFIKYLNLSELNSVSFAYICIVTMSIVIAKNIEPYMREAIRKTIDMVISTKILYRFRN